MEKMAIFMDKMVLKGWELDFANGEIKLPAIA